MSHAAAPRVKGKITLRIHEARDLIEKDIGKQDPFLKAEFSGESQKTKTHKKGGTHPKWDQHFLFTVKDHELKEQVKFEVWDEDNLSNDKIGRVSISLRDLDAVADKEDGHWFQLLEFDDSRSIAGYIRVSVKVEGEGWPSLQKELPEPTSHASTSHASTTHTSTTHTSTPTHTSAPAPTPVAIITHHKPLEELKEKVHEKIEEAKHSVEEKKAKLEVQLRVKHSGQYLNIPGSSQDDNAQLIQWGHESGANSTFYLHHHVGHYEIVAKHSGKHIGADDSDSSVIQSSSSGHKRQQWELKHHDDGSYAIINVHSGKGINIPGSSKDPGAKAILWDPKAQTGNERWYIEHVFPSTVHIRAKHSGSFINVPGSSQDDGVQLIQWSAADGDNSKFLIKSLGESIYEIVAKHSGKHLGADDDDNTLIQTSSKGHKRQRWHFKRHDDGSFAIINVESGKGINVPGSSKDNGTKLILWNPKSETDNERWYVEA